MSYLSRHARCTVFGLALGLLQMGVAAEPGPTPLPEDLLPELKAILVQAVAQSPQMIQRNIDLASNEGNYLVYRGQMLPIVSGSATYNYSDAAVSANTNVSSRSSGLYYSVSVSQPVFRWGTLKAQTDAAKIQLSIAQKNYVEAYRTLALTIRGQYLGLIVKKVTARNAHFTHGQAAANLAREEEQLKNGRSTESQVVALRLSVEELQLGAERADEDFAQSKRYLQRQAGLPELADDRIPDNIPPVAYDAAATGTILQDFLGHGWEENLTVQVNRSQVRVAELNYKVANYRLYPMVGLSASVSQTNTTSASLSSVSQVSVLSAFGGVTINWAIFDGFATRGAKIGALANKRLYERQLQTVTDQLLDQAMSLERQAGFSYRAMSLAQTRAGLSEAALRTARDDAARGQIPESAVEAATGADNYVQMNLLTQRADFLSRWAEFISTTGHDPILQQLPAHPHADAP
jgi:outer membrane protein TolC